MFRSTNVRVDKCLGQQMFGLTNVWVDNCLGQEMFGLTNVWVDKCSGEQMFGSTKVQVDKYSAYYKVNKCLGRRELSVDEFMCRRIFEEPNFSPTKKNCSGFFFLMLS
jgi:hypothetical protein